MYLKSANKSAKWILESYMHHEPLRDRIHQLLPTFLRLAKNVLGLSFLLRQGQDFLLEIHNRSRHTFSQYSKEGKRSQNGSSFVIPLDPTQARLFTPLNSYVNTI